MKIAFTGSQGSGKSDRVLETAKRLKRRRPDQDVGLIQEIAHACPLPVNRGMTLESQCWIASRQIAAEIETGLRYPTIVTDRCILDPWVYGLAYDVPGVDAALREVVQAWLPTYDRVVLVDANRHNYLRDDGFRDTDPVQRLKVYDLLREWLEIYAARGLVKRLEVV